MSDDPLFLTVPTLARRLDVGDGTVRRLLAAGVLLPDGAVDVGSRKAHMPIFDAARLAEIRASVLPRISPDVEA